MKRLSGFLLVLSVVLGGVSLGAAQEKMQGPPKVLTIFREVLKPGKAGMVHEKAESAFVQAYTKANWPTHYFAATSLSGKPRALFFVGYDSFAAWEKDNKATEKNAALAAALDRASMADGELLSEAQGLTFVYREDQSLRANVNIAQMRYFDISVFHVKPGHEKEWDEAVKLVTPAYEKMPDVHWATFEVAYGAPSPSYAIFTPMRSLDEVDKAYARNKDFMAALGEAGMKRLSELSAAAIDSMESNLFQFAPKMSYVSDDWVKADPDFWKPKAAMPAGEKKTEKKPAKKE